MYGMPQDVPVLTPNLPQALPLVTPRVRLILPVARVRRRPILAVVVALGALVSATPARADARPYLPPPHKIFAGVAGSPVAEYVHAVGKHPPVYEVFSAWGEYLPGIFQAAAAARARLMIHVTTAFGAREAITPGGIARGDGDRWLIALNRAMYQSARITYIRLMAEMDADWNPYGAFNADGSRRNAAHSTASFKRAWKRVTLILRGGTLHGIDAELRHVGMPVLRAGHDLPRPRVAMLWVPQSAGAPDVAGNQPRDYYPGSAWVDWVGTDFYGKFPNFAGLTALYNAFPRQPFMFGEYALWGADDPAFVDALYAWVGAHPRARMLVYNQGITLRGPFRLWRYPRAARELHRLLAGPRFPAFPPEIPG
jgi:hypothetical protein